MPSTNIPPTPDISLGNSMSTTAQHRPISVDDQARLGRRAQLLAAASVTYNGLEAVVAIGAGLVAGSGALVGFGLDSMVEVSSGPRNTCWAGLPLGRA